VKRLLPVLTAAMALALLAAAPASAAFGLKDLDVTFTNPGGSPPPQAGSHPFALTTVLGVNAANIPGVGEVPEEEVKDLTIGQMEGLVGNPIATPRCSAADFNTRVEGRASCPDSTAVGIAAVKAEFTALPPDTNLFLHVPVYNLAPSPGEPAKLGFVALNVPVTVDLHLNNAPPYNIVASLTNIPQALLFYGSEVTLWGNPESSTHNSLRGNCVGEPLELTANPVSLGSCPVNVPEAPFLTLPRACQGPLATLFSAVSWQNPTAPPAKGEAVTHDNSVPPKPLGMTGCESLGFSPQIEAKPTTGSAESPTGLDFSLDVKDEGLGSPSGRAQSDIKKVEATLPAGMTVNPSAAEGLGACTKAQYEATSLAATACPASSKLGTVQITTPLLEESLEGSLFLAQQDDPATSEPEAENPFDSLIALYLVIKSPRYGILVKQAGKVEPDPKTGQLVSTFEDIPQLPFSHFKLHFREGPRPPLISPPGCGTYTTNAVLTPWSGNEPITEGSTFTVNSGVAGGPCPPAGVPPFAPSFEAGSINNNAGSFSPFYMRLTRKDGEQEMTRFDSVLPSGVTGKIAGIAKCPEAAVAAAKAKTGHQELASPSCPQSSEVGHVLAGAGVGSALTYVPGKIYLGGPFAGDPLSVIVITPAVAGPFDAGTVVVREALTLDPTTAEVQVDGAASDPIPHILKGIPLKLRDLRIYIDRPNFTLNPTSCDPEAVKATLFGGFADVFSPADDVPVALGTRYQAANCSSLAFAPKLSLKFTGGTKRNDHPALRAVVSYPPGPGYANIGAAQVTLPHSELIDNAHITNPCTRVQFNANQCPPSSVLGTARAFTPLLDEPLEGPVYFRSNGGEHLLPDIVADLHGQFHIVLVGHVDSVHARIRNTFETVPDAPVSKFVLNLNGGKKGLLVNNRNLCAHTLHVKALFTAQNGTERESRPRLGTSCRGKKPKRKQRIRHP
jgi:hypothetical protein